MLASRQNWLSKQNTENANASNRTGRYDGNLTIDSYVNPSLLNLIIRDNPYPITENLNESMETEDIRTSKKYAMTLKVWTGMKIEVGTPVLPNLNEKLLSVLKVSRAIKNQIY